MHIRSIILFYLIFLKFILIHALVVELTALDFDDVVDGSSNVLVKFYAPWCGHCKKLAPELEIVGGTFDERDKIIIAKVNVDEEKSLAAKFSVSSLPTVKWFPQGKNTIIDIQDTRSALSIVDWINKQTGLQRKIKKSDQKAVLEIPPEAFDHIVYNPTKHVFVGFYAPWCEDCKKFDPVYEQLGKAFEDENDVIIAKMDAATLHSRDIAQKYGFDGNLALRYFGPDAAGLPETYEGSKSLEALVEFLNQKAGTYRSPSGHMKPEWGRVSQLDDLVQSKLTSMCAETLSQAEKIVDGLEDNIKGNGAQYIKVIKKILEKGPSYIGRESMRLAGMIESAAISPAKKLQLMLRKNIIDVFMDHQY